MEYLKRFIICTYIIVKGTLIKVTNKNTKVHLKTLFNIITVLFTLMFQLSTILFTTPFAILKLLTYVTLRLVYRNNFGGFLDSPGTAFRLTEERCIMTAVLLIEDVADVKDFYEKLKAKVRKMYDSNYKLRGEVKTFLGYFYYVKNAIRFDGILSESAVNENDFVRIDELFDFVSNTKMNSNRNWEVKFIEQKILDYYGEVRCGILIRIDHSLCDGFCMMNLIKKYIYDEVCRVETKKTIAINSNRVKLDDFELLDRNYESDGVFIGGKHQILTGFHEETPLFCEKVKNIQRKLNVTFSDILASGLNASITRFLKRNEGKFPKRYYSTATYQKHKNSLSTEDNFDVRNNFTCVSFVTDSIKNVDAESIKVFGNNQEKAKTSIDIIIFLIVFVAPYLPGFLIKSTLLKWYDPPFISFHNLSRLEQMNICGKKVTNFFAASDIVFGKGVSLMFNTYDDRLQLSLIARQKFVKNLDDLKNIMLGILDFVNALSSNA